jgi:aryl-alcohol dehydrogenase-like predicted oxidoreductase
MECRHLGRSGLPVSVIGLGCDNFGHRCDEAQSAAIVHRALDLGIIFFDTADIYGPAGVSEEYLGKALKGRRKDVVIATKFVGPVGAYNDTMNVGSSRRHIMNAIEDSLRRLGTEYVDLYQLHSPFPAVPIEETLRALDDLIRAGKVRYIGNSNMSGWQVVEAEWTARSHNLTPFASAQNEYNLLDRRIEKELTPACEQYGLGILPYFPLASGLLTGKYHRGEAPAADTRIAAWGTRGERMLSDQNFDVVEKLEAFAKDRGKTLLDLAFSWLASHDYIPSVIAGATKPEQVEANAAAAEWKLTPKEMAEVDTITAR